MKRVNLQKIKSSLTAAVILAALFTSIQIPTAQAATVGSNQCVQTVDSNAGVSVYQDLGFCYVAFKNVTSYTWTPPATLREIDLLVVAGGGGGGSRHAGGGGAGGLINSTSVAISGSDLSISVGGGGAGGAATTSTGNDGANGSNSQISGSGITTRIAVGGGRGAYNSTSGSGGSSGGGGCCGNSFVLFVLVLRAIGSSGLVDLVDPPLVDVDEEDDIIAEAAESVQCGHGDDE
jgi:hypothetical protein